MGVQTTTMIMDMVVAKSTFSATNTAIPMIVITSIWRVLPPDNGRANAFFFHAMTTAAENSCHGQTISPLYQTVHKNEKIKQFIHNVISFSFSLSIHSKRQMFS